MCSKLCPCLSSEKTKWKALVPEDKDLTKYERTWTTTNSANKNFKTTGTKVPMDFSGTGTGNILKDKGYKDFSKCYTEQIKGKTDTADYSESYKKA
jgi:hypothetical protein